MSCDLLLIANRKIDYSSEEARLIALFDQPAQESEPVSIMSPVDTLAKSLAEKSQIGNSSPPTDQGELLYVHYVYCMAGKFDSLTFIRPIVKLILNFPDTVQNGLLSFHQIKIHHVFKM